MFDLRERTLRAASGDRHSLDANEHQLSSLKTAHELLLLTLIPMIDDAAFDLVLTTERVNTNNRKELTEFIDVSADVLQLLLTLRAEGSLAVSLLEQAASTSNVNLLQPLSERFVAAKEHVEQILRQLPPSPEAAQVQKAASMFIDFWEGRRRRLRLATRGAATNRCRSVGFGGQPCTGQSAWRRDRRIGRGGANGQQCSRLWGGAGYHKRRNFHVDHYGREHRRRRSRYALLRCAVDHSASRKYYQGDGGPCGR